MNLRINSKDSKCMEFENVRMFTVFIVLFSTAFTEYHLMIDK